MGNTLIPVITCGIYYVGNGGSRCCCLHNMPKEKERKFHTITFRALHWHNYNKYTVYFKCQVDKQWLIRDKLRSGMNMLPKDQNYDYIVHDMNKKMLIAFHGKEPVYTLEEHNGAVSIYNYTDLNPDGPPVTEEIKEMLNNDNCACL
jgi:hypothetical protein